MRKMTFLVAALALAVSGSAYAGEKVDTNEGCCREGDDGCTAVYEAKCDDTANIGYFCSTDKNDKDGDGSKTDRVVWQFVCDTAAGEVCTNTNGSINCLTAECTPKCEGNVGHFCDSNGAKTITCEAGTKCDVSDTGYVSCVADDDDLPTGTCDPASDTVGCTAAGNGYYCNSKTNTWGSKICSGGKKCSVSGTSVDCLHPETPTGTCDAETVQGQCSTDKSTGWYCKNGSWVAKNCEKNDCVVNDKVNSVSCGGGGGGEQGTECSAGEAQCDSASAGWYCSNGNKKAYTCNDGTCGTKIYNGKKQVTCCTQNASGEWYDVKYSTDACESVYGQGTDPVDPPPGGCSQDNYCSADGKLAYNCNGTSLVPTACMEGKSCKLNNGKAECVGSINPGSKDDDDDDSGCAAAGAGLMLGWLGLALVPALRRRKK